jgi:hypothetical protein
VARAVCDEARDSPLTGIDLTFRIIES